MNAAVCAAAEKEAQVISRTVTPLSRWNNVQAQAAQIFSTERKKPML